MSKTVPKRELIEIHQYGTHYSDVCWCGNCGKRNYFYIPKGIKKKNCAPIICDNCGCDIELE